MRASRETEAGLRERPFPPGEAFCQSVTQDALLLGSLHAEYKRCGKPTCRCAAGGGSHGPYWYRRWREGGRQRKAYVPSADLARVRAAIRRRRETFPPLWPIRRALIELRRTYQALGGEP